MKKIDVEKLKSEHENLFDKSLQLCKEIRHQMEHLMKDSNIQLAFPIQHRPKTWSSIINKIEQGRYNVKNSITELQDLVGIRIVLLFQRDISKIISVIEEHFHVIKKYNTGDKLEDNQFGYSSIHIITKISESWLKLPSFSNYKEFLIEFQIRTIAQHSWAEASNIFQYKKEDNVPKPLKRSISRISALLETVDLEYERLLEQREQYKIEVKQTDTHVNGELNVDVLEEILDNYLPKQNKRTKENYSELLGELMDFSLNSKKQVIELIKNNLAFAISEEEKMREKQQTSIYFSHVGFGRNMLGKIIGTKKYNDYLKNKYKAEEDLDDEEA